MNISNKFIIAKYIDENKDSIIKKYGENMPISEIAELYGVTKSIIYLRLVKWGIKIKKFGTIKRRKNKKIIRQKRKFSPELQAKMEENTRINNQYIKVFGKGKIIGDKFLVRNILKKSKVIANE